MDVLASLRAFNTEEQEVFKRLLDIGEGPWPAMEILAVRLWQEFWGHYRLIEKVNSHLDETFSTIATETKTFMRNLQDQYQSLLGSYNLSSRQYQDSLVLRKWAIERIDDFLRGL